MNKFLQVFKVKEIRNKILIVAGLLIAFRLLAAVPIPGVNAAKLQQLFSSNQLFGFLNLFSGGGLYTLSVAMLAVGPYITATIIMQLLTIISPRFKEMYYEEGARGQAKFNQYSRLLTVPLALLQSYGFLTILISRGAIDRPDALGLITNVLAITAGTMLTMWLGELISEQKIGNGISLIILAGIVSRLPSDARLAIASGISYGVIAAIVIATLLLIYGIVYLNEGERKVPVAYARRVRGMKMYGGASSYLPLKVNQAGMIPLIFAVSVILFPQFFATIITGIWHNFGMTLTNWVNTILNNQGIYAVVYFLLVFAFTYFYTAITFNPDEISKNLQRSGGFIPGIRPGEQTSKYFSAVMNKITLFGAVALGLIAILPTVIPFLVQAITGSQVAISSTFNVSSTALLIVVAVALEAMRQIDSQLTVREYEGLE